MQHSDIIIDKLFRSEFSKMVAIICRKFGLEYIEIAEDIVSDTFLTATENWKKNSIPVNPTAWLYVVAKQKTLYQLRRDKILCNKVFPNLSFESTSSDELLEMDFTTENIKDSQLQMIFAICNPVVASEAQIALALRILCGFTIDEIAEAFFTNKEVINKRLFRAKQKLRSEQISISFPVLSVFSPRLDNVLHVLYLMFNEGYYSSTSNQVLRKDLCFEALRLVILCTEFKETNQPRTNALAALMCYHYSRLSARVSTDNRYLLYDEQDEQLWDQRFIEQGNYFLELSTQDQELSTYHLEAGIAFWHSVKLDSIEKWENILIHYNLLLEISYSPFTALNRAYALYKVLGADAAIIEVEKLQLTDNHFYFTLLGELYSQSDQKKAYAYLQKAITLARTDTDKKIIRSKLDFLNKN